MSLRGEVLRCFSGSLTCDRSRVSEIERERERTKEKETEKAPEFELKR